MPQDIVYTGFIVKTQDLNEADILFTFFSQQSGKLRFLAKSIKKMTSKLRGRLQPNCLVEVVLTSKGSLPLVINAQVLTAYSDIITRQEGIQAVLALQEVIVKVLPDELPNSILFERFQEALKILNEEPNRAPGLVVAGFIYTALVSIGLAPTFPSFTPGTSEQVWYNLKEGVFKERYESAGDQGMSKSAYAVLREMQAVFIPPGTDHTVIKEVLTVLASFLSYHMERDLKALDYVIHQLG